MHLLTTIFSFTLNENNFLATKLINKRNSVWKNNVSVIKIAGKNVFDTIYFKIFIDENNTSDLRPVYLTNSQNIITKYDVSNYINMHMRKHHLYKYINDLKTKISNKKYLQNYNEMIRKEYKSMHGKECNTTFDYDKDKIYSELIILVGNKMNQNTLLRKNSKKAKNKRSIDQGQKLKIILYDKNTKVIGTTNEITV